MTKVDECSKRAVDDCRVGHPIFETKASKNNKNKIFVRDRLIDGSKFICNGLDMLQVNIKRLGAFGHGKKLEVEAGLARKRTLKKNE